LFPQVACVLAVPADDHPPGTANSLIAVPVAQSAGDPTTGAPTSNEPFVARFDGRLSTGPPGMNVNDADTRLMIFMALSSMRPAPHVNAALKNALEPSAYPTLPDRASTITRIAPPGNGPLRLTPPLTPI